MHLTTTHPFGVQPATALAVQPVVRVAKADGWIDLVPPGSSG